MKRYKGLGRIFLLSYFTTVFGGMVFALLLYKLNPALLTVFSIICLLDLAGIIVARVFMYKNFKVFFITATASFSLLNALVVAGFILELVYANNGEASNYALFVSIASLVCIALIDVFYVLGILRYRYDLRVANGEIKELEDTI